jgi:hypothetical protein
LRIPQIINEKSNKDSEIKEEKKDPEQNSLF